VANNALRVRVPAELLPKTPAVSPAGAKAGAAMTDDERRTAMREVMTSVGFQRGTPATPDMIEKAKKLATDKGLDPDLIVRMLSRGSGGGGGGFGGSRDGASGASTGVGMNVSNQPRTLYKLVTDEKGRKTPEPVTVHLGISDGTITQVLDGVAEGDTLITYVTMPGSAAPAVVGGPPGQSGNPFQQNQRGGPGGGGFGGPRGF
jgi:HlyD family secretion protein